MQNHTIDTKQYDVIETAISVKCSSRVNQELKDQGYTDGLIHSLHRNLDNFPLRICLVDNSGSMITFDGHFPYHSVTGRIRVKDCTRYDEIVSTAFYHARTAALLEAPTIFKLLNPTETRRMDFNVAQRGQNHIQEELSTFLSSMESMAPHGATPLTARVQEIAVHIASIQDDLRARGQKAAVILATDGLPSNQFGGRTAFTNALRRLEGLPVWVVIRLCTDDESVVDFYNNLDSQLELSLEVLDDYFSEALEVYEHNKWLNYGLPMHRMREMGFYHKHFDLIDERPLIKDELTEFFQLLYGADVLDGLPDPQLDWDGFLKRIAIATASQPWQWNPVKKKMMPWVSVKHLDRKYGGKLCLPKNVKTILCKAVVTASVAAFAMLV